MSSDGYGGPRDADYGEKEDPDQPSIPGMPAAPSPRKESKKKDRKKDKKDTRYAAQPSLCIVFLDASKPSAT